MANVRALLFPAAAALVVAGCGGTRSLTHRQLVSRGNQICIKTDRAVQRLGQATRNASYWNRLIPISKGALTQMSALTPPRADRADFDRMMQVARREVAALTKVRNHLRKAETAGARTQFGLAATLDTRVKSAAKDVGFDFCSQPVSNWPA